MFLNIYISESLENEKFAYLYNILHIFLTCEILWNFEKNFLLYPKHKLSKPRKCNFMCLWLPTFQEKRDGDIYVAPKLTCTMYSILLRSSEGRTLKM